MTNRELEEIAKSLEQLGSTGDAYLGYSNNDEFGYLKGNKDGLLLCAAELIKAANEIELRKFNEGDNEFYNSDLKWSQNENGQLFEYIQITNKNRSDIIKNDNTPKTTFIDKLIPIGCLIVLLFGVFLAFLGLRDFIDWVQ